MKLITTGIKYTINKASRIGRSTFRDQKKIKKFIQETMDSQKFHNIKTILETGSAAGGIIVIIFSSYNPVATSSQVQKVKILIGFENTIVVLLYLADNNFLFESLCFQTVYILDALSAKLGFSIYIPAVVNIFSFFQNFLKMVKLGVLVK